MKAVVKYSASAALVLGLASIGACSTRTAIGDVGDAGTGGMGTGGRGTGGQGTGGTGTGGQGTGGVDGFGSGGQGTGSGGQGTGGFDGELGSGGQGSGGRGSGGSGSGGRSSGIAGSTVGGTGGRPSLGLDFRAPQVYASDKLPSVFALGDLNNDGKLDVAMANYRSGGTGGMAVPGTGGTGTGGGTPEPGSVELFSNRGDGTFAAPAPLVANRPDFLACGDINGDGKTDLVMANGTFGKVGGVAIRLNTGTALSAAVTYTTGNTPYAVALGDVNRDGRLDLAVANRGDINAPDGANTYGDVGVLSNLGNGSFSPGNYSGGKSPVAIAIGDLDGDGNSDLAVGDNAGGVKVLLNNSDGTFAMPTSFGAGTFPYSIAIGDLNGDGKGDIVVAASTGNGDRGVFILTNLGAGRFSAPASVFVGTNILLADMNGDGRTDLVTSCDSCAAVNVFSNSGTGALADPATFDAGAASYAMSAGDLNGDGKIDLVVKNDNGFSVLLNASR
jgi:hypothetical protein